MNFERQGAKQARQTIKRFQEHINSPRLVPDQCYRMASTTFGLVCWVNQVTGLFLSKNYYVIPFFLQKAQEQIDAAKPERVSEQYRHLAQQYLCHIAHFIVNYDCLKDGEKHVIEYIPKVLLEMQPSELPEDLIIHGEF